MVTRDPNVIVSLFYFNRWVQTFATQLRTEIYPGPGPTRMPISRSPWTYRHYLSSCSRIYRSSLVGRHLVYVPYAEYLKRIEETAFHCMILPRIHGSASRCCIRDIPPLSSSVNTVHTASRAQTLSDLWSTTPLSLRPFCFYRAALIIEVPRRVLNASIQNSQTRRERMSKCNGLTVPDIKREH